MNLTDRPIFQKGRKPSPADIAAGKRHMARVAQCPCVICHRRPVQVHHCICGRFSQSRASDFQTIPLCPDCHLGPDGIHSGKESWVARNGEDHEFLAVVADMLAGDWVA